MLFSDTKLKSIFKNETVKATFFSWKTSSQRNSLLLVVNCRTDLLRSVFFRYHPIFDIVCSQALLTMEGLKEPNCNRIRSSLWFVSASRVSAGESNKIGNQHFGRVEYKQVTCTTLSTEHIREWYTYTERFASEITGSNGATAQRASAKYQL